MPQACPAGEMRRPRLAMRSRGSLLVVLSLLGILLIRLDMGHQQADLFLRDGAGVDDAGNLAAAQDQNPVAQLEQHVQILADIDDGCALLLLLR